MFSCCWGFRVLCWGEVHCEHFQDIWSSRFTCFRWWINGYKTKWDLVLAIMNCILYTPCIPWELLSSILIILGDLESATTSYLTWWTNRVIYIWQSHNFKIHRFKLKNPTSTSFSPRAIKMKYSMIFYFQRDSHCASKVRLTPNSRIPIGVTLLALHDGLFPTKKVEINKTLII